MRGFASRVSLLTGLMVAAGSCLPAAHADPSLARLHVCVQEPNDATRLACYDKEMGRAPPGQPADFGMTPELMRKKQLEAGITPPPVSAQPLSAKVTGITPRPNGRSVVTLDNGQVWEEQEDVDLQLKVGDAVTITPGTLGSLWMDPVAHRGRVRVRRIK
jgi:hypothetical protein